MPPLTVTADRHDHGQTLASVLKSRFHLTWSKAKRVIEGRHVRVGGQIVADAAYRVKTGKRISVAAGVIERPSAETAGQAAPPKPDASKQPVPKPPAPKQPRRVGEDREPKPLAPPAVLAGIEILFSDASVVVVNKPAGLTTVRQTEEADEFGRGKRFLPKTLADLLPTLLGEPNKPVIAVHRLDRDTSGVVVFARTRPAAARLMEQFRKHTADRRYMALVRGVPAAGRTSSIFVRDRGDGRRGSASGPRAADGRSATTHVSVKERFGDYSLVECRLETGRTHQVRIHLGEAGTPLCGEMVYDRPVNGQPRPDGSGARRPMLHAAKLGFLHPTTQERREWIVPPPADFHRLLEDFRSRFAASGPTAEENRTADIDD